MSDDQYNRYLGDGVYASFDGYQIWLAANDHTNRLVALEPSVLAELIDYARVLDRVHGQRLFGV